MAKLSWGQLQKRNNIDTFIDKIDNGKPFLTDARQQVILSINTDDPKADQQAWYASVKRLKANASSPKSGSNPLIDAKGKTYKLSSLQKTDEFGGGGFNAGNVGEGVFAAAITARFLSKTKDIDEKDVIDIIKGLPPARGTGAVVLKKKYISENLNPLIKDDLFVEIELSRKDMDYFKTAFSKYRDIIQPAVDFCNNRRVKAWADKLYINDKFNIIKVKSLGVSMATNGKVDTWVEIGDSKTKPRRVDINISLKVRDIGQFGQVGGTSFKGQQKLWGTFGYTVDSSLEKKYVELVAQQKEPQAFKLIYQSIFRSMDFTAKNIGEGILYHATLGDPEIELVQLSPKGAVVYEFDQAVTTISRQQLTPELIMGKSDLPTLRFLGPGGQTLVQIRVKKSGETSKGIYYRSVVEKGKFLTELIGRPISNSKMPIENQY